MIAAVVWGVACCAVAGAMDAANGRFFRVLVLVLLTRRQKSILTICPYEGRRFSEAAEEQPFWKNVSSQTHFLLSSRSLIGGDRLKISPVKDGLTMSIISLTRRCPIHLDRPHACHGESSRV